MNCVDVQTWLCSPLTAAADADTLYEISRHIDNCEECRNWYDEMQELSELWEDETPVPDLDLVTPVLAALSQRTAGEDASAEDTEADKVHISAHSNDRRLSIGNTAGAQSRNKLLRHRSIARTGRGSSVRAARKLPVGASALNYGVAASVTIALFGFGFFQHAGSVAHGGLGFSIQLSHLISIISNL